MPEHPEGPGESVARPFAAAGLVISGGLLLLAEGVAIDIADTPGSQSSYSIFPSDGASIGALGAFFGFVLLLLGVYLLVEPAFHRGFGIGVVALSLITIWINFGFLVPVILIVLGGILGIMFRPDPQARSMPRTRERGDVSS